jgi:glycolate oxidase iron-sulfur subunit
VVIFGALVAKVTSHKVIRHKEETIKYKLPLTNYNALLKILPDDDILSQCIHCGMCLATCPTYELTKLEISSPRGRIKLINAVAKGQLEITDTFAYEMNFCLDCQACETACPAGVKYGTMVEASRNLVEKAGYESMLKKIVKKIIFGFLLLHPKRFQSAARILYYYQNSKIRKILHSSYIINKYFKRLIEIDKLAPAVSKIYGDDIIPEITKCNIKPKFKTAILTGCLMDVMFADINIDTAYVLNKLDCEVIKPKGQVCCGSLPGHNGDYETAKEMAKRNIDAFEKYDYDYLISNSSGCGAFMKEYKNLLKDDPHYANKAVTFSNKVKDVMEFIDEKFPAINFNSFNETITYHDACHLVHTQKIFNEPRRVLNSVKGLKLNELEEASWCCGSAGIYNIIHYKESMVLLQRKMNHIKDTKAKIVLAGNHGCIAQLKYGAAKFNINVEVRHPVTFLKKILTNE